MEKLRKKQGFICDMDGVIYHGDRLLPEGREFEDWLYREDKSFLFLTNSSQCSPKELQQKLGRMGLEVDERPIPAPCPQRPSSPASAPAAAPTSSAARASSWPSTTRGSP